jgi:predicted  nucleic acid-binding Zn-ribbon protein
MLAEVQEQKVRLEAEMARLTQQISTMRSSAAGDVEKAMAKIETARNRLEERLTTLTRENKKLRDRITSLEALKPEGEEERRENTLLREQINDLAAEVVNLTLMVEGPDSPIHKTLAQPANGQEDGQRDGQGHASLADKVRALRKAVPAPADATRPLSVSVKETVQRDR